MSLPHSFLYSASDFVYDRMTDDVFVSDVNHTDVSNVFNFVDYLKHSDSAS